MHLFPLVGAIIGAIPTVVCVTLVFVEQKVVDYYGKLPKKLSTERNIIKN